jgi:ataxin-3
MLNELDHDGLDVDLDHDDEEVEEEEEDYTTAYHAGTAGSRASGAYGGPTDFAFQSRSYDDEDEALQAALKASMEGLPEGYVMPELKPIVASSVLHSPPLSVAPEPEPAPVQAPKPAETAITQASKDEEEFDDDDDDEPAKELSPGRFPVVFTC